MKKTRTIIKMAQINTTVGDIYGNTEKVIGFLSESESVVVFPELTLVGYPPLDLVQRRGFLEKQDEAIAYISKTMASSNNGSYAVLGVISKTEDGSGLYNSLVVLDPKGKEVLRYHKQLLPTYNIFDESRIFTPGPQYQKPTVRINGFQFLFAICEDMWSHGGNNPMYKGRDIIQESVQSSGLFGKPDIIVTINSSPANIDKPSQRYDIATSVHECYGVPVVYVNQVGGNDDLVFDGGSFVVNHGDVETLGFHCEDQEYLSLTKKELSTLHVRSKTHCGFARTRDYVTDTILLGIKDYVEKSGFHGVTISLSGGIDSAVVAALAVRALGPDRVECTTMPSKYSSEHSVSHSKILCENLGIVLHTLEIEDIVVAQEKAYEKAFGEPMSSLARENLQAAVRGNAIMRRSNSNGRLVLIGSNKSEGSVGYFTMFGDSNGGLAPIGDLYKTEVYEVARILNRGNEVIPDGIINKAPSAELAPGQVDTNSLPPYHILDAILALFLEGDLLLSEEASHYKKVLRDNNVSNDLIAKIVGMVDRSEYKRRMLAPILRVHKRSFGPGRVIPLAKGGGLHTDFWSFR